MAKRRPSSSRATTLPAPLGELRQKYLIDGATLPAGFLAKLEADGRDGTL